MKHTKGEIKIGYDESKIQIYSDNNGIAEYICELPDQSEKSEANAKLITAASELLEFAIEMVKRYPNSEWIYKQGNAAIKKATE